MYDLPGKAGVPVQVRLRRYEVDKKEKKKKKATAKKPPQPTKPSKK